MKARSAVAQAGVPPQGAESAAPVIPKRKPCCSMQGRFPSPSLLVNLRPARQAPWQRRTLEHSERRWASPLDCLGCRLFVFNSAAATVWGHRGSQTPPEAPGPAVRLAKTRGCTPAFEGAPGERGALSRHPAAGKTFPEPPRHGWGSPPVSGVGRTRGGRRRRRRRARPSPLLPRSRLQGPTLGRSSPHRRKNLLGKQGFSGRRAVARSLLRGRGRRRSGRPHHLRGPRPTLPLLPSRLPKGEGIASKGQPGREFLPRESRAGRGRQCPHTGLPAPRQGADPRRGLRRLPRRTAPAPSRAQGIDGFRHPT